MYGIVFPESSAEGFRLWWGRVGWVRGPEVLSRRDEGREGMAFQVISLRRVATGPHGQPTSLR